jgi:hypothetical protein
MIFSGRSATHTGTLSTTEVGSTFSGCSAPASQHQAIFLTLFHQPFKDVHRADEPAL